MRKIALVGTALAFALAAQWGQAADQPIPDDQLGLSKTSVYDVPDPKVFEYQQADPTTSGVLPRAYPGAPPQVSHDMKDMVPITREMNMCVACHQLPDMVGKKKVKGQPTAVPASHYVDVKANSLYMGRYNCTQCHTPQATVKPLVDNVFGKPPAKK